MPWTMVKEMNEMSYGSDGSKMNWIIEVDNVIREELRLSEYVMMWCKPIKDSLSLSLSVNI